MKIAALIFGIFAGLAGLPLASYAQAFIALGGGQNSGVLYLIPVASFVGAGIAMNLPGISAGILGVCAFIWLAIGGQFGHAINFITIGPVIFNGIGALLAGLAALNASQIEEVSQPISGAGGTKSSPVPAARITESPPQFDRAKWNALVKYDPEIKVVYDKLKVLGDEWVDRFAADYLALNDKAYLTEIALKIIADANAKSEAEEQDRLRREEEQKALHMENARRLELERQQTVARRQTNEEIYRRWSERLLGTRARTTASGAVLILASGLIVAGVWWNYFRAYEDVFAFCRAVPNTDNLQHRQYSGAQVPLHIFLKINEEWSGTV